MVFRRFTLLLLLFMVSGCGSPDSAGNDETPLVSADVAQDGTMFEGDMGALNELMADWVEMWNSYDLDMVGELFLNDDRLTYFSSEKDGLIRGMDAVLEHHRGFDFLPGGNEKPSRLWLEDVGIDLIGGAAVLTGIWFFQTDPDSTNEPQRGPVTIVCIRTDTGWRFVHMNFSSYMDPEASVQDPT